jgi:hypothetical protein
MAQKVSEPPKAQSRSKYPIDEWIKETEDGSWMKLTQGKEGKQGVDYAQATTSMRSVLYTAAKARGLKIETRTDKGAAPDGKDVLYVRFVAGDDPSADAPPEGGNGAEPEAEAPKAKPAKRRAKQEG